MWNSQEKIQSTIPCEQKYMVWLVKNGKIVFSKFTWKISLSVSGKQASQCTKLQSPLNHIVLKCYHSSWTKRFKTRQYDLGKIFPNLLTTSNIRWIKQKATQTPMTKQRSRKDLWKTNNTDREEQDTGRVALFCWKLPLYKS